MSSGLAIGALCQSTSEELSKLERGRTYSDSILLHLRADLYYLRSTEDLIYPLDWNKTLHYMKDRLTDKNFGALFSCEISKWLVGDYFVNIGWDPVKYEPSNYSWLPVYVFLPVNKFKKATIASIRDMSEQAYLELPNELSNYYRIFDSSFISKSWELGKTTIRITGDSLELLFPIISRTEYYLVSKSEFKKTKISALEFSTWGVGPNEIMAEFQDSISEVVFAFPVQDSLTLPRFVDFDSTKYTHLLDNPENTTVISTPNSDMVFVGSTCPVPISIDMLWDSRNKVIRQLRASFGVSLGNENPCYRINYLLNLDDEYFVLRIDERAADLIFLKPHDFRILTIADETAPEL